jgi:DNA polymerase-4
VFGRYTERVQQRAAGIDDRPVIADVDEKQISAEETFATDIADRGRLQAEIARLADRACGRLRARKLVAGCVIVKIRRGDFTTYTRQRQVEPPTRETRVVSRVAAKLLDGWLRQQPGAALRLLGVGVSELGEEVQSDLFAAPESTRNQQLDATVDRVRERFGSAALKPASALNTWSAAVSQSGRPDSHTNGMRSRPSMSTRDTPPVAPSTNSKGVGQPGATKRRSD